MNILKEMIFQTKLNLTRLDILRNFEPFRKAAKVHRPSKNKILFDGNESFRFLDFLNFQTLSDKMSQ